jgi:hypothetical protein
MKVALSYPGVECVLSLSHHIALLQIGYTYLKNLTHSLHDFVLSPQPQQQISLSPELIKHSIKHHYVEHLHHSCGCCGLYEFLCAYVTVFIKHKKTISIANASINNNVEGLTSTPINTNNRKTTSHHF